MIITDDKGQEFRGCTIGKLKEFLKIFNFPDDYIMIQNSVGNLMVISSEKDGHWSEAFIDARDEKFTALDSM